MPVVESSIDTPLYGVTDACGRRKDRGDKWGRVNGSEGTFVSMVSRLDFIMGDVHLRGQCRQQDEQNKMSLHNAFAAVRGRACAVGSGADG